MEPECYPSSIVPHSSRLFLDYTESAEPLTPFYSTTATGRSWMREAGIPEKEALALLGPMAAATVANIQKRGLARSFSGPLARGDAATVKLHREGLAGHPLVAHVYDGLARLTAKDLPSADRAAINTALRKNSGENWKRH